MKIVQFEKEHIKDCVTLACDLYLEASDVFNFPEMEDLKENLTLSFGEKAGKKYHLVALVKNRVIGYWFSQKVHQFAGKSDGVYVALENHGAILHDNEIYEKLYTEIANLFVENKLYTHAITIYAHQKELIDFFTFMNFGFISIDAIKKVTPVTYECDYEIRQIRENEADQLFSLTNKMLSYLGSPPILLHRQPYKNVSSIKRWMLEEGHRAYGAFDKEVLVSYIKVSDEGESFITNDKKVKNICGTYTEKDYRGKGLTKALLSYVNNDCYNHGFTHMGVDFESSNTLGRDFWLRYFNGYTVSLMRKLDERVSGNR